MNAMELIRQRRSVRTFDGKALKAEDREKLLSFAAQIGNPSSRESCAARPTRRRHSASPSRDSSSTRNRWASVPPGSPGQ